jgi:hypothetical protein
MTATSTAPCTPPLCHDRPCQGCGHPAHTFLPCSETCACTPPPTPGLPVHATTRHSLTVAA